MSTKEDPFLWRSRLATSCHGEEKVFCSVKMGCFTIKVNIKLIKFIEN